MSRVYAKIYRQLNIQLVDARGNIKDNETVLKEVFDTLKNIPDAGEQFRILQALFSEAGRPLRTWINDADAVSEALSHLKVNTEDEIRAVGDLNQSFDNLAHIFRTSVITTFANMNIDLSNIEKRFQELSNQHLPTVISTLKDVGKAGLLIAENWRILLALWTGAKISAAIKSLQTLVATIKAANLASQGLGLSWALLKTSIPGIIATLVAGIVLYRKEIAGAIEDTKNLLVEAGKAAHGVSTKKTVLGGVF